MSWIFVYILCFSGLQLLLVTPTIESAKNPVKLPQALQDFEKCDCGVKRKKRKYEGLDLTWEDYFFYGYIIDQKTGRKCGGAMISNVYYLTAASCLKGLDPTAIVVLIPRQAEPYVATKSYIHPNFDESTGVNNIAVLQLSHKIHITLFTAPICLPFQHSNDNFDDASVSTMGFGETDKKSDSSFHEYNLKVTNSSYCKRFYPRYENTQICTISDRDAACKGENGDPIVWQDPDTKRLVLVGVHSIDKSTCKNYGKPSVNTRVSPYIKWIISVTEGAHYCRFE